MTAVQAAVAAAAPSMRVAALAFRDGADLRRYARSPNAWPNPRRRS